MKINRLFILVLTICLMLSLASCSLKPDEDSPTISELTRSIYEMADYAYIGVKIDKYGGISSVHSLQFEDKYGCNVYQKVLLLPVDPELSKEEISSELEALYDSVYEVQENEREKLKKASLEKKVGEFYFEESRYHVTVTYSETEIYFVDVTEENPTDAVSYQTALFSPTEAIFRMKVEPLGRTILMTLDVSLEDGRLKWKSDIKNISEDL